MSEANAVAKPNVCRFCERTDEQVVDKGGAMVTVDRCNSPGCYAAFWREYNHKLAEDLKRARLYRQLSRRARPRRTKQRSAA